MGFLHKLWDETLAGPAPESGLGRLRKYNAGPWHHQPAPAALPHPAVTRSITVVKTAPALRSISVDSGSVPGSPSGSSTPGTPLTPGTPDGKFKKLTRTKPPTEVCTETGGPTIYDWVVISSLDR